MGRFSSALSFAQYVIEVFSQMQVGVLGLGYDVACKFEGFLTRRGLSLPAGVKCFVPAFHLQYHNEECRQLYRLSDWLPSEDSDLSAFENCCEYSFRKSNKHRYRLNQTSPSRMDQELVHYLVYSNCRVLGLRHIEFAEHERVYATAHNSEDDL